MTIDLLHKEIARTIRKAVLEETQPQTHFSIIEDEILERHLNSFLESSLVVVVGIHRFIVLDFPVTNDRLRLEFTALCYLNMLSAKYMKQYPTQDLETRVNSSDSILTVVSRKAFGMFECFHLGVIRQKQSGLNDLLVHFLEQSKTTTVTPLDQCHVHQFVVMNKTYGKIRWATREEIDHLLHLTRWTTNIFGAHGLTLTLTPDQNFHLNCVKYRVNEYFYVQCCEEIDHIPALQVKPIISIDPIVKKRILHG